MGAVAEEDDSAEAVMFDMDEEATVFVATAPTHDTDNTVANGTAVATASIITAAAIVNGHQIQTNSTHVAVFEVAPLVCVQSGAATHTKASKKKITTMSFMAWVIVVSKGGNGGKVVS